MATKHGQDAILQKIKNHAKFGSRMRTIGIIVAVIIIGLVINEYVL